MLEALLAGVTDPERLAELAKARMRLKIRSTSVWGERQFDPFGEVLDRGVIKLSSVASTTYSRHVDIQADHQEMVQRIVGLHPVDSLGDVRSHRLDLGRRQGRRGEVNRGDLPSVRSEPERVGSVAAARVDGASGTQVTDLGGQMGVRGPLGDAIECVQAATSAVPRSLGRTRSYRLAALLVVDGQVHRLGGPMGLLHDRRSIPAMALLAVLFGSTQPLLLRTR